MTKQKHGYHNHCYFVLAITIIFIVASQNYNISEAAPQIESNSTFTTCINGKCVTTTTTCIINQPCHTVRSNSTNTSNNNDNSTNGNNNGNGVATEPFSQGTI
jgi:hypothetical protein